MNKGQQYPFSWIEYLRFVILQFHYAFPDVVEGTMIELFDWRVRVQLRTPAPENLVIVD